MTDAEMTRLVDAVTERLRSERKTIRVVRDEVPLGACVQANYAGQPPTTIIIQSNRGLFEIEGVRSLNRPEEIRVERVCHEMSEVPFNAAPFDSASYALEQVDDRQLTPDQIRGYYLARWGTLSPKHGGLIVTFSVVGNPSVPPSLNWTLFGKQTHEMEREAGDPDPTEVARAVEEEIRRGIDETKAAGGSLVSPTTGRPVPSPTSPWGIPQR
jgi:hypothetical protein